MFCNTERMSTTTLSTVILSIGCCILFINNNAITLAAGAVVANSDYGYYHKSGSRSGTTCPSMSAFGSRHMSATRNRFIFSCRGGADSKVLDKNVGDGETKNDERTTERMAEAFYSRVFSDDEDDDERDSKTEESRTIDSNHDGPGLEKKNNHELLNDFFDQVRSSTSNEPLSLDLEVNRENGNSSRSKNPSSPDSSSNSNTSYQTPAATAPSATFSSDSRLSQEAAANQHQQRASDDSGGGKGALYEAYNLLHTLAQDFKKPFDAPAVLVVGHQSSGKSALIEALMGFQFNQVGGGTKTRRPIALRMQYNPNCHEPKCYLLEDDKEGGDGMEHPKTLNEIQDYIERENRRLERDPVRCFDSREINVRMEYKYCPNMILIDTPGLISAPRMSSAAGAVKNGGGGTARMMNTEQRALIASAREAERLVVNKMRCEDYIILCVEDTCDWKHGATREIIQKADPDLSRTVIVQTKLDTKIPQFGTMDDMQSFLRAEIVDRISPRKLGGPFFTSVPSGRVHRIDDEITDDDNFFNSAFESDEDFVHACVENEDSDRAVLRQRFKRKTGANINDDNEDIDAFEKGKHLLQCVGLSRLRVFLEQRVDECYRRNVAKIVPVLQAEHASATKRLEACERELDALSMDRLKAGADQFCDEFCSALREAIQGTIIAPPALFGETLKQENLAAGSFHDIQCCPMAVSPKIWQHLITTEVGNTEHRLYGGSQYHRAMREFGLATRCLRLPTITEDEIANAAGVGDTHDGVNFLRTSCVIALEKARVTFDPLLEALRLRCTHVMSKLCSVSEYMLQHKRERNYYAAGGNEASNFSGSASTARTNAINRKSLDLTQSPQFRQLVRTIFDNFLQKTSDSAMSRCRDDLVSLTKFVTWDLHERSGGALRRSLPDQMDLVAVYRVAVKAAQEGQSSSIGGIGDPTASNNKHSRKHHHQHRGGSDGNINKKSEEEFSSFTPPSSSTETPYSSSSSASSSALTTRPNNERSNERDYFDLLQLMEEAACSRDANRTNLVVGGLVQHIVSQWRESFCRSVTTKFNCFFLLPFVDEFQSFFRSELQRLYAGDLCDVFDLGAARRELQQQRNSLIKECDANKRLQNKFDRIATMMREQLW